jgi:transcriptional regulator with XRE-family HTH domain
MAKTANSIDRHIGMRVRRTREFRDMSQQAFAAALGVSLHQVKKYESGFERIGASELAAICRVLNVRPSFFFAALKAQGGDPHDVSARDGLTNDPASDLGARLVSLAGAETPCRPPILDLLRRLEAELRAARPMAAPSAPSVSGVPEASR